MLEFLGHKDAGGARSSRRSSACSPIRPRRRRATSAARRRRPRRHVRSRQRDLAVLRPAVRRREAFVAGCVARLRTTRADHRSRPRHAMGTSMLIGIPRETRPGETRVAATPETVKKLAASGKHAIVVESGRRRSRRAIPDDAYVAAGATIGVAARGPGRGHRAQGARARRREELAAIKPGAMLVGLLNPFDAAGLEARAARRHGLRAGLAAAHLARAVDGRAVVAGEHRRLQGRGDRGGGVRALHADADDGRGHGEGRPGARHGRRRGRAAGDRDRQAAGRGDRGVRRAPFGQGPGRVARRRSGSTCPTTTPRRRQIAEGVGGYARPMPPEWMARQAGDRRRAREGARTSSSRRR